MTSLGQTRRERLRDLLFSATDGLPLDEIEKRLEARRGTILADLEHLRLSFKHQDATLLMVPPTCMTCGFVFRLDVPKAPSKCPVCKQRNLSNPIFKAQTGVA
jgi:predicted Zn-ribbon and HTH transcriptional regulator